MPISLDDYRQITGRDFQAGESYAKPYGWSDRGGAAVDSFQAGLLGVGEALGADSWADARRENQYNADVVRSAAIRDTRAPRSLSEIDSLTSAAKGAAGLLVDSSPYLATSALTGGAGALAGIGAAGRLGLAAVAGYPSAVGDILQNQRDEAGRTDAASAFAYGVPYAAADMVGLDGMIAAGRIPKLGLSKLDNIGSWKGGLARAGANTGITSLAEGGGETLQEFANQAGRIAVNPDQTMFNPEANERYAESFGGGALLGGAVRAPLGSWARSDKWYEDQAKQLRDAQAANDLEQNRPVDVLQLGLDTSVRSPNEIIAFPDGSAMTRSEYEATFGDRRPGEQPGPSYTDPNGTMSQGVFDPLHLVGNTDPRLGANVPTITTPARQAEPTFADLYGAGVQGETPSPFDQQPLVHGQSPNYQGNGEQSDLQGFPYQILHRDPTPVALSDNMGNVAATPESQAQMSDPGAVMARQIWQQREAEKQRVAAAQAEAQRVAEQAKARKERAKGFGVPTSEMGTKVFQKLEELHGVNGVNNPTAFQEAVNQMAAGRGAAVNKLATTLGLKENATTQATLATSQATANTSAGSGTSGQAATVQPTAAGNPATQATATTAVAPVTQPAQPVANTGEGAGGTQPTQVAPIGPQGGKKSADMVERPFLGKTVRVKKLHWDRIAALLGMDESGRINPNNAVSQSELARRTGVGRSAINETLRLFKLSDADITNALRTDYVDAPTAQSLTDEQQSEFDGNEVLGERPEPTNSDEMHQSNQSLGLLDSMEEADDGSTSTGYRTTDSLADAAKGDHFEGAGNDAATKYGKNTKDGFVATEDGAAAKKQADASLKSDEAKAVEAKLEAEAERKNAEERKRNEDRVDAAAKREIQRTPKAALEYAANLYDSLRSEGGDGTSKFRELSPVFQLRFIGGLLDLETEGNLNDKEIDALQRGLEREWESRDSSTHQNDAGKPDATRGTERPAESSGKADNPAGRSAPVATSAQVQGSAEARESGQVEEAPRALTHKERAAEAWNTHAEKYGAPEFHELPTDMRHDWYSYGEENWTEEDFTLEAAKLQKQQSAQMRKSDETPEVKKLRSDINRYEQLLACLTR